MEYIAISKNIGISPRKMRLVVDGVKKLPVPRALTALAQLNKRAATPIRKALEAAIANAVNLKAEKETLVIKSMFVGEGIVYKRYHFAGRGRTRPYKKRKSHLTVVLETLAKPTVNKMAQLPAPTAVEKVKEAKKSEANLSVVEKIKKRVTKRSVKEKDKK